MASFLDELGKTIFNQQDLAEFQQVAPTDLLGRAQGLLPQVGRFNQGVAANQLALAPYQNQIRGALYGQAINPLQEAYTSNILSNLNLGNQLPADVQQQVLQGALQGTAASGFGLSPGGRALVGRDLGLSSLDIGRQRRGEAFNTLNAFKAPEIQDQLTPVTALQLEQNAIDTANEQRFRETANRNANRQAIIQSLSQYAELGGSIFGSAVGSAFGTKGFGSMLSGIGGRSAGGAGMGSSIGGGGGGMGYAEGVGSASGRSL